MRFTDHGFPDGKKLGVAAVHITPNHRFGITARSAYCAVNTEGSVRDLSQKVQRIEHLKIVTSVP